MYVYTCLCVERRERIEREREIFFFFLALACPPSPQATGMVVVVLLVGSQTRQCKRCVGKPGAKKKEKTRQASRLCHAFHICLIFPCSFFLSSCDVISPFHLASPFAAAPLGPIEVVLLCCRHWVDADPHFSRFTRPEHAQVASSLQCSSALLLLPTIFLASLSPPIPILNCPSLLFTSSSSPACLRSLPLLAAWLTSPALVTPFS